MNRVLPLLLALLLLSACAGATPEGEGVSALGPTESVTEAPTEPSGPLDLSAVALDGVEGFYDLSALPQLAGYEITASQLSEDGLLYFLAGDRGQFLHRLDLNTGAETLLCEIPVQEEVDWISTSLLCADPLAVCQSAFSQESVWLVDADGDMTPLAAPEGMTIATWNTYFTDTDCIWMDAATDQLIATPLSGAPSRVVGQIPGDYFYCALNGITADGGSAILSANCGKQDAVWLTVSLESGEVTGVYVDDGDSAPLYALRGGVTHLSRPDDAMEVYTITVEGAGRQLTCDFPLSLLAQSDAPLEGQDWWLDCYRHQSFWGRTLVTADHYADRSWLLLWDYSGQSAGDWEPAELVDYVPPVPVSLEELEQRAANLSSRYGISIHTGEDTAAPFPDYTLSPCMDTDEAAAALDVLEQTFALYPEDYFRQLGGDSIRGLSFYLCGRMTPIDPSSNIDSPGGLSCLVDGVELLAFDITGEVRVQDVVHELTHVLDHWLWEGDVLDENRWSALNPADFSYYYAYVNPEGESYEWAGSTRYTTWDAPYYEGKLDSVWFIDPYSTTYPTEDRARLMEYLLCSPDEAPDYFQSIHLQAKLNYYFLCIRERFDDSAWPELTSWEAALGPVG